MNWILSPLTTLISLGLLLAFALAVSHSAWNRAKRQKKIAVIDTGPMKHTGRGDYFDRKAKLPNGQPHADKTAAIVSGVISGALNIQP